MRLRSRISVRHTTNESMLNPRPARIPDTRDNTPGSFCTRQFRTCLQKKIEIAVSTANNTPSGPFKRTS